MQYPLKSFFKTMLMILRQCTIFGFGCSSLLDPLLLKSKLNPISRIGVSAINKSHSNAKHFSSLYSMRISIFEVMSVYLKNRYQNNIPRAMPLLCFTSWNFKCISCSWHIILLVIWKCSAWGFTAQQWRRVWIEMLQLTDQRWKYA